LYESNHSKYFHEHPYFSIRLGNTDSVTDAAEIWKEVEAALKKIPREYEHAMTVTGTFEDGENNGRQYTWLVFVTPNNFCTEKLNRLRAHKEFTRIAPANPPDWDPSLKKRFKLPW
jgi:hypothetical protein